MKLIERNNNILDNQPDLEDLETIENFPVFMGCVEHPVEEDISANMTWSISANHGVVQLKNLVPLNILYGTHHDSGVVGNIWIEHHKKFAEFIKEYSPNSILEIGGAHGILSREYSNEAKVSWVILEPNPAPAHGVDVEFIQGFFDEKFNFSREIDTIVHSHVLEHIYNPDKFISDASNFLKDGQNLIFSIPNMEEMLKRNYTNCINFEHTILLTEPYIEYLMSKNGFKKIKKEYFKDDHSIFYAYVKDRKTKLIDLPLNLYSCNKKLYSAYSKYLKKLISSLNQKIANTKPEREIFLFGAHVFAQTLIAFGLNTSRLKFLLDNDFNKQDKRLYGTKMFVKSPRILQKVEMPIVILKAGIYNKEISDDILNNINPKTIFWD